MVKKTTKIILVIETKTLYRMYIKNENADMKSFPNSFYLKEVN